MLAAHLSPGDAVAVEDPGWPGVHDLARMLGLRLGGVAVDARGMLPRALAAAERAGARAVVLTPRGHNPCGAAMDAARARDLRAALSDDVLVIEDDHLGPVAGTPWHTLVEPGRERWAAVRSVSKWLGPDLRLAVHDRRRGHARARRGPPGARPGLGQRDRPAARRAAVVRRRASWPAWPDAVGRLRRAPRRRSPPRSASRSPPSGINLWVPVADEDAAVRALLADGCAVAAGRPYRLSGGPAIRITTAAVDVSEAPALAAAVGRAASPPRRTRAA